jgi:hypothetical protein
MSDNGGSTIAIGGHISAHAPQSSQFSFMIFGNLAPASMSKLIAPLGHSDTHTPQDIHKYSLIKCAIVLSPLK